MCECSSGHILTSSASSWQITKGMVLSAFVLLVLNNIIRPMRKKDTQY